MPGLDACYTAYGMPEYRFSSMRASCRAECAMARRRATDFLTERDQTMAPVPTDPTTTGAETIFGIAEPPGEGWTGPGAVVHTAPLAPRSRPLICADPEIRLTGRRSTGSRAPRASPASPPA